MPAFSALVTQMAVPSVRVMALHRVVLVVKSVKVTVPVGVPLPGAFALTAAVRATLG